MIEMDLIEVGLLGILAAPTPFTGLPRAAAADAVSFVPAVAASFGCLRAASRTPGRGRRGWIAIAIACWGWAASDALWTVFVDVLGAAPPYPSPVELGYLIFPVGCLLGLLRLAARPTGLSVARRVLDGLMVGCALGLVTWVAVLDAVVEASTGSVLASTASLYYLFADVALVTVVVLTVAQQRQDLLRWALLGAGVLLPGSRAAALPGAGPGPAARRARPAPGVRGGARRPHDSPVVDPSSGDIVALEALARWTHEGQDIPPSTFVPICAQRTVRAAHGDHAGAGLHRSRKPALAAGMLIRALRAGVPARGLTGNEVYGADPTLRAECGIHRLSSCWRSAATDGSPPTRARPRRHPGRTPAPTRLHGSRLGPARRASGSTSGPESATPTAPTGRTCWTRSSGQCRSAATATPASCPSTAATARNRCRCANWSTSPDAAGASRKRSRPARGLAGAGRAPGPPLDLMAALDPAGHDRHALLTVIALHEHNYRPTPTNMIDLTCAEIRRLFTTLIIRPRPDLSTDMVGLAATRRIDLRESDNGNGSRPAARSSNRSAIRSNRRTSSRRPAGSLSTTLAARVS